MRLIRRRPIPILPSDVLDRISILLAECRTSSTREQIVEHALDQIQILVPSDSMLLLDYSTAVTSAGILDARGGWAALIAENVELELQRESPEPSVRIRGIPLPEALGRVGSSPLRVWSAPLRIRDRIVGSLWLGRDASASPDFSAGERKTASIIADIIGCELLQLRLTRRTEDFQVQLRAARSVERAIASSMDLTITLNVLLDQATRLLGADAAAILLLDVPGQELHLADSRGFRNPGRPPARMRADHSLALEAVLERRTVWMDSSMAANPAALSNTMLREEGFLSYGATPLIAHGRVRGALEVFRRSAAVSNNTWNELLESLALEAAIAVDCAESFQSLQRTRSELAMLCDSMLEGFSRAVDLRAREAEGHSVRVSELSMRTAQRMGVSEEQMPALRRGALLHDIGKIGVPDSILWKTEALNDDEWQLMRQHPKYAEQVLAPIEFLKSALDIPKFHHEHWDGGGYPYGLEGDDIPLSARVFAVVDVWDSLQSRRPFREPWSASTAAEYLTGSAGRQFDPDVVRTFMQILRESED
jgi:HD-GYP domain-containing protein (c-di-GMP phosphodiesterase class II)